jgi:hypothetical protein
VDVSSQRGEEALPCLLARPICQGRQEHKNV